LIIVQFVFLLQSLEILKSQSIYLRTNYPDNKDCKDYMTESGLLNVLYDEFGKPF